MLGRLFVLLTPSYQDSITSVSLSTIEGAMVPKPHQEANRQPVSFLF